MRIHPGLMLLAVLAVGSTSLEAQPPREIHGRLFWVDDRAARSAAGGVEISSQAGDAVRTAPAGSFRLPLPPVFRAGETLTVMVDVAGWFIGRPADGEVVIPVASSDPVEIELYREGSEAFWSDERLERFLVETAWLSLERFDRSETRHELELDFFLRRWARRQGWAIARARDEVEEWIGRSDRGGDALRPGLAALARGALDEAAVLFRKAAEENRRRLDRERASLPEGDAHLLERAVVRAYGLEGIARSDAGRFDDALGVFERALELVSRQESPQLWARMNYGAATVHLALGTEPLDPGIRVRHLEKALEGFRGALTVWDRRSFPEDWAAAQHGLGRAFTYLSQLGPARDGARQTQLAIRSLRAAAELRPRHQVPYLWASTQSHLATSLLDLVNFTPAAEGRRHLAEAVEIFRRAAEVWTFEEMPDLWAATEANRAFALGILARFTPGREGVLLYQEMAGVCREILRRGVPELDDYGRRVIYEHLANAATQLAARSVEDAPRWLAEAAAARRSALALLDRDAEPADWALGAYYLGGALVEQGRVVPGSERAMLFAEADDVLVAAAEEAAATGAFSDTLPLASLAEVRWNRDRTDEAVALMQKVLEADPNYHTGHLMLRSWAQDFLHDYELAYRTLFNWIRHHPEDVGARVGLSQNLFTLGRFEACLQHITAVRREGRLPNGDEAFLRVFEIAALRVLGHPPNEIASLVVELSEKIHELPPELPAGWQTRSSSHFLRQDDAAAPHRSWLLRLFETLRLPDRKAVVEGLERLAASVDSPRA